jgi:hypothetical protein
LKKDIFSTTKFLSDMNLSWNVFFIFTAVGLVIYYGAVLFVFFRKKRNLAGSYGNGTTQSAAAKQQRSADKYTQPDLPLQAAAVYIDTKVIKAEDYAAAPDFTTEAQHEDQPDDSGNNMLNQENSSRSAANTAGYETAAGMAAQLAYETAATAHAGTEMHPPLHAATEAGAADMDNDTAYKLAMQALSAPGDMLTQFAQPEIPVQQADSSNAAPAEEAEIPLAVVQEDMRQNNGEPKKIGSLMHLVNKKSFQ